MHCTRSNESETPVAATYRYTGLSGEGDACIDSITEKTFAGYIDEWAAEIPAYLARGTTAAP